MTRSTLFTIAAITWLPAAALAQAHGPNSPHAGQAAREIKALSAEEVEGFLAGRGMGLATAAELNRFPGPRHVLELADELSLSAEQATRVGAIFDEMQGRAALLGRHYVERERELDRVFAQRTVDGAGLAELTTAIGRIQGELRNVHLRAHLQTTGVLTRGRTHLYDELRGYADAGSSHRH